MVEAYFFYMFKARFPYVMEMAKGLDVTLDDLADRFW